MKTALIVFLGAVGGFALGVLFTFALVAVAARLRDNEMETLKTNTK